MSIGPNPMAKSNIMSKISSTFSSVKYFLQMLKLAYILLYCSHSDSF